jgi:selenophosphate synthase
VLDWIAGGAICGGTARNIEFMEGKADYGPYSDDQNAKVLLNDSQTSGGLLVSLSPADAETFRARLDGQAWAIGRVVPAHPGTIRVL